MTKFFLVLRSPDIPRNEWQLAPGQYVVGRSKNCEIAIFDGTISREHARVSVEADLVKITDLKSRNGTYIDDDRVESEELLNVGCTIRFGRIECVLADAKLLQEFVDSQFSTLQYQRTKRGCDRERLSVAKQRVLDGLLDGLSEKEVAARLDLSPNTVHHHITEIYRILEVSSRGELLALFVTK